MTGNFNSYIDCKSVEYWKELCRQEGKLIHFDRGEYFFREGEAARYFGLIKSGTLKYITYGDDGTEHVLGLVFTDEFVGDFPFSFHGMKARTSVIAVSPCEIFCISSASIQNRLSSDSDLTAILLDSTEAVFSTVYDRYKALYTQSPQQRYNDLITKYPDLFSLFPLRDIASFLKITPTHLSRLRKNI